MAPHYIIVLLLFGLTSIQATSILSNECPADFHIHRLLPHETDCDKFYQCSHGERVLMHCAAGTLFNAELQVCVWPDQATCKLVTEPPVLEEETSQTSESEENTSYDDDYLPNGCPKDFGIHLLVPHETECDKFYQCSNGQKYLQQCGAGLLFDDELQVCNWPQAVVCHVTTTNPTIEPATEESTTLEHTTEDPQATTEDDYTTEKSTEVHTTIKQTTLALTTEAQTTVTQTSLEPSKEGSDEETAGETTTVKLETEDFTTEEIFEQTTTYPITSTYITTTESTIKPTTIGSNIPEETTIWIAENTDKDTTDGSVTIELSTIKSTTQEEHHIITEHTTAINDFTTINNVEDIDSSTNGTTGTTQDPDISTTQEFTTVMQSSQITTEESITTTQAPICPAGVFGNVPHPERCDAFFLCSGGVAFEVTCSNGFEFDPVAKVCVEIDEGGCTLGSVTDDETNYISSSTTELPTNTENITDESVTQEITYTPVQDLTTLSDNPTTQDFTAITQSPINTTEESIMTTQAPICPAGVFGNVPHPERCDAFFLCAGGTAFEVACSSGFEFDSVSKVCVEITEGGCTLGPAIDIVTESSNSTNELPTTENIIDESVTEKINNSSVQDSTTKPGNDLVTDGITEENKKPELSTDYPSTEASTTLRYTTVDGIDEITQENIDVSTTVEISTSNTQTSNNSTESVEENSSVVITEEPLVTSESTTMINEVTSASNTTEDVGSNSTVTQNPDNSTTQDLITEPICPAGVFGNVPHPERCDAYFLCSGGFAFEVLCSSGFEFNLDLRVCVEISEGGCTLGQITNPNPDNTVSVGAENTTVSNTVTEANVYLSTTEESEYEINVTTQGSITQNPNSNGDENESTTQEIESTKSSEATDSSIWDNVNVTVSFPPSYPPNVSTDEPTTEADTTDLQEPICPSGVFGNVPDPERCNAFYICSGGFTFQVFCSNGFEFDPESKECVEISEGGCTLGPVTKQENIELFSTTMGDRYNENITTETHNEATKGVTDTETNTTDATWDTQVPDLPLPIQPPVNPGTDNPNEETSTEITTTIGDVSDEEDTEETTTVDSGVTEPVCPAGVFGNVPHDSRCDAYYLCSAGMAFEVLCPSGFEFDPALKNCVEIAEGGCTLKSNHFALKILPFNEKNNRKTEMGQKVDRSENMCQRNLMDSIIPHEHLCTSFYRCLDGDALQLFCSEGFEFESRLKICIPINDTGCTAYKRMHF